MKGKIVKIFVILGLVVLVQRIFVNINLCDLDDRKTVELSFGAPNLAKNDDLMDEVRVARCVVVCDSQDVLEDSLPKFLKEKQCTVDSVFLTEETDLATWKEAFSNVYRVDGDTLDCLPGSDFDILLFDLQGFGSRLDRTTRLLASSMSLVAKNGSKLILLDSPNPMGGKIEGPGAIPLRPGVTVGELALYWNDKLFNGAVTLEVVPVLGWERNRIFTEFHRGCRDILSCSAITWFIKPFCYVKPFSSFLNVPDCSTCPCLVMGSKQKLSSWESSYLRDMLATHGIKVADYDECSKSGFKVDSVEREDDIDGFGTFMKVMRFFSNRKTFAIDYENDFDEAMGCSSVRETLLGLKKFSDLRLEIETTQLNFVRDIAKYLLYDPAPYPSGIGSVKSSIGS